MIKASTILFLKALKKNNDREWFDKNRARYDEAKEDHRLFIEAVIKDFSKVNPKLKGLTAKECVFRIYRDVRFSKNKDPYKTNMGAGINPGGKKMEMAGAYIHIEPGKSFIAGGRWMPDAPTIKAIRQEIDYNLPKFKKIIFDKNLIKQFKTLEEEKLKTAPKGYPKDHPEIELLKYTSYIVSRELDDKLILSKDLIKELTVAYKTMLPFLEFLNEAVD